MDKKLLKYELSKRDLGQSDVQDIMGWSYRTAYTRLSGKSRWKIDEAKKLCNEVGIEKSIMEEIFFAD